MLNAFNQLNVMDRGILIAVIGLGIYFFFVLVDVIKTYRNKRK